MINEAIGIVDLKWSNDGDFTLANGDLADTIHVTGSGFLQEVEDRVKSSSGDWKLYPSKGSNLEDFKGENNDPLTWALIEQSITYALTANQFLNKNDFKIVIAPISPDEIAIKIDFDVSLTEVQPDSTISIKMIYNLDGNGPFIIR